MLTLMKPYGHCFNPLYPHVKPAFKPYKLILQSRQDWGRIELANTNKFFSDLSKSWIVQLVSALWTHRGFYEEKLKYNFDFLWHRLFLPSESFIIWNYIVLIFFIFLAADEPFEKHLIHSLIHWLKKTIEVNFQVFQEHAHPAVFLNSSSCFLFREE